jgi:hypothetical protein
MSIEEMINSERVLNELGIWQKEVIARVMQNYAEQEKKKEAILFLSWYEQDVLPFKKLLPESEVSPQQLYELFKKQK